MAIRIASKNDVKTIRELVVSLSHFYLANGKTDLPKWFLSTLDVVAFENRLESEECYNLVYEPKNEIIGYISMSENGHVCHLFGSEQQPARH